VKLVSRSCICESLIAVFLCVQLRMLIAVDPVSIEDASFAWSSGPADSANTNSGPAAQTQAVVHFFTKCLWASFSLFHAVHQHCS
jgi:hypothetical protein